MDLSVVLKCPKCSHSIWFHNKNVQREEDDEGEFYTWFSEEEGKQCKKCGKSVFLKTNIAVYES